MNDLEPGAKIRLEFTADGVERAFTGIYESHETRRETYDEVGTFSLGRRWCVTNLGTTFLFAGGEEVEVPPDVQWRLTILEPAPKPKPKLPTTPGSRVQIKLGAHWVEYILADDEAWYLRIKGRGASTMAERNWELVKDAGAS